MKRVLILLALVGCSPSASPDASIVAKARRLEAHCRFMKLHVQTLIVQLDAPSGRALGSRGFSNLANGDLREVKLCVRDENSVDPDDRALACSQEFRDDVACMRAILVGAIAQWMPE